jgi:hypothetical protein
MREGRKVIWGKMMRMMMKRKKKVMMIAMSIQISLL